MFETLRREFVAKIVFTLFILLSAWWIALQFMHLPQDSDANQLFAAVYGLIALFGGICGLLVSRKWGGFHSVFGKSVFFFSLGLLFQEVGQLSYSFYIYYLRIPTPYPSIGDFFFYGTIPLYITAVLSLAKASGIRISKQSLLAKSQAILIPLGMLLLSYFVFLQGYAFDWTNPLKVFIDFAAPLGQAVYISFAILTLTLTHDKLGGLMKPKVMFILLALFVQYIADWTFLYQANRGTWYAGGIDDYMYLCAYFLMTFSLIQLNTILKKLKHEESKS